MGEVSEGCGWAWAALRPYPHIMVNKKPVLKDNYGKDQPKGTIDLCVSVLGSSRSLHAGHSSAGEYDVVVRKAPSVFVALAVAKVAAAIGALFGSKK